MFSSGPSYNKLKTNLRLCINRLKLLEKKKTELALKSRKEIADYISLGKAERAKIRVEHIIREDYLVEALEMLEMFCDLLLARFGLIQQMKTLDDGLAESISSLIWVAPRLQADVQELKIVSDQLSAKYGKPYAMACRENAVGTVSEKLMHKLSVQAPPKVTVEKYLIEIAKYYNVDYEPDTQVLSQDEVYAAEALIDLAPAPPAQQKNDLNQGGPGAPGAGGAAPPPAGGGGQPYVPFAYPAPGAPPPAPGAHGGAAAAAPYPYPPAPGANSFNIPPSPADQQAGPLPDKSTMNFDDAPPAYFPPDMSASVPPPVVQQPQQYPPPPAALARVPSQEDNTAKTGAGATTPGGDMPELPEIPDDIPTRQDDDDDEDKKGNNDDDIDFDDLTKRFEALKKKK